MHNPCGRWFRWILLCAAFAATRSAATTLVYDSDEEIAAQSDAVVLGKVAAVTPEYVPATNAVRTRVTLAVQAVVAGQAAVQTLDLIEPGGEVGGLREEVFGTPQFRPGERALVFVQRDPSGQLRTTGLAMGKFTIEATAGGTWVARRDYRGARVLRPRSRRFDPAPPPEERPLSDVIAEAQAVFAARGEAVAPVEFPPPGDDELDFSAPFTLLGTGRWFQADFGEPVAFWLDRRGLQALGAAATEEAIRAAMAAWSDVPGSFLALQIAGSTDPVRFEGCSGTTRITFDDPFAELAPPTDCRGILALGGYCSNSTTAVYNGTSFSDIYLGKIVFNDGWDACGVWTPCNVAEVATHELGHTIGLGHSTDTQATMAPYAHFDGRCAALMPDDINGLRFVYGVQQPDLVLLPRPSLTLELRAGSSEAVKEFTFKVRNADGPRSPNASVEAVVSVTDGTCPAGTVRAVDTDPATDGLQTTLTLGPRQSATVRVTVGAKSDQVDTAVAKGAQRCTLQASVLPAKPDGQDRFAGNNTVPIVVDSRDANDFASARSQTIRETAVLPLAPVRVTLPRLMPWKTRTVRFRVANLDQGTNEARIVTVDVDPGDCPPATLDGWDLSPGETGDQHSLAVPPRATVVGALTIAPPSAQFFTPSRYSPSRCTMWIRALPAEGETNLSNNSTPLVLDVVDQGDF